MTMTSFPEHPKWDAFKTNFIESNYITDVWNWLLTLLSKSAELVLFGSILYSSYQLIPGVPAVPAGIDAFLFLMQQAALDIGGMGLLKLAKRAGLPRNSFPMQVGVTLVVLMILNVVLATVKHALPMVPGLVFVVAEAFLLIIRAVMAVLFGHAIHALREEYGDSMITIKEARELEVSVDEVSRHFQQAFSQFSAELSQFSSEFSRHDENFHSHLAQLSQRFQQEFSSLEQRFQQGLHESSSITIERFHHQFSEELSALRESMQQFQAHMIHSLPKKEEQAKRKTPEKRPILHVVPLIQEAQEASQSSAALASENKFDARKFVFACLQEHPDLKLVELSQLAQAVGQELSLATASRYRKQFWSNVRTVKAQP
jgi:hypothetical protein